MKNYHFLLIILTVFIFSFIAVNVVEAFCCECFSGNPNGNWGCDSACDAPCGCDSNSYCDCTDECAAGLTCQNGICASSGGGKTYDSECTPPYSGYGGTASSCSRCPTGYLVCYSSQGSYDCYQSTKVGTACTKDTTSQSGVCNNQGECSVTGDTTAGGGTTSAVCPEGQICNPLKYDTFEQIVDAIIKFIFWVGVTVAPVMFVISGFMFITSAGDPAKAKNAKNLALYAAIGLAVVLVASGLVKVIQSIIGVK